MAKKNPQYDIVVNYDNLANHLFTELTDLGYVVAEDELLDIADIAFEYIIDMLVSGGIEMDIVDELDELDEGDVH